MYHACPLCLWLLWLGFACSLVLNKRVPTQQRIRVQFCLGVFPVAASAAKMTQRSAVAGEREGQRRAHGAIRALGSLL